MTRRAARWLVPSVAATVLLSLGITYYFTVMPAPTVKVRWRATVTPERRADLERRFLLVRPTLDEGRTYRYDLLDTSRSNMEALAHDPAVEDTADIDVTHFTLPPDYPYGSSWTWAAYRVPILRAPGVVGTAVGLSAVALIFAAVLGGYRVARRRIAGSGDREPLTRREPSPPARK